MQTSRSFNWYTRMWRAWITQPFNSTVTYGQLNMLHLKSVGESLVVPYGGSNIFFMIQKNTSLFLRKYDGKACLLLNLNAKLGFFYNDFDMAASPNIEWLLLVIPDRRRHYENQTGACWQAWSTAKSTEELSWRELQLLGKSFRLLIKPSKWKGWCQFHRSSGMPRFAKRIEWTEWETLT